MWEKEDCVTCTGLQFATPGSVKRALTRDAPDFIQTQGRQLSVQSEDALHMEEWL